MKYCIIPWLLMLSLALTGRAADCDVCEFNGIYYRVQDDCAVVVAGTTPYAGDVFIPPAIVLDGTSCEVTAIGDMAFCGCLELTSVNIPNSVKTIGNWSFKGCTALYRVEMGNAVSSIGEAAFEHCAGLSGTLTLPDSVTRIERFAFNECTGLSVIKLGNGVTHIGENAFGNCTGLTGTLTIPNSVITIGNQAFMGCTGLTDLNLGRGLTDIGYSAFADCSGLEGVSIPCSVTTIGPFAFLGCNGLTTIAVEGANSNYDSRDGCNAIIETASNTLVLGCMNTVISNTVTAIGNSAFADCTGLTSLIIPDSVTSLGWSAFTGCTSLVDVYCHITDPGMVTMGKYVFSLYPEDYSNRTLHVPAGSAPSYQSDDRWYPYFGSIVEMNEGDVFLAEPPMPPTVVRTEYYSLAALQQHHLEKGFNIVVTTLNDGSHSTAKVFRP